MFGFGARKDDIEIDELTMEQRVQEALARLTAGESAAGAAVAPSDLTSSLAPDVAAAGPDACVDYVLEALRADGRPLDRATVTRVLALGREYADKTLR